MGGGRGTAGSTGGASFTPRLTPRPKPLSNTEVLQKVVIEHIRNPLCCIIFLKCVLFPLYQTGVQHWIANGWSERSFFIFSTTLVHGVLYWCGNSFMLLCPKLGLFEQYKIPRTAREIPKQELIMRTFREALFGQLVVGPCTLYFIYDFYKYMGMPPMDAPLPSVLQLYVCFLAALVTNDWGFYWSHRMVHSKAIYKYIHKQHHTYVGTIGFAAEFANPVEQIVSNQLPTAGACIFGGVHLAVWLTWLAVRLEETYEAHSGYCFKGSILHQIGLTNADRAAWHDFHHTGNRGNFGAQHLDHMFGTMDSWLDLGGMDGYVEMKAKRAEFEGAAGMKKSE